MKKVEEKKVEKKQKPKVIETKFETKEEVSVKGMIHGKRKVQENKLGCPLEISRKFLTACSVNIPYFDFQWTTQNQQNTVPKRAKTNEVVTKKFGERDFKIFGSHKLKK